MSFNGLRPGGLALVLDDFTTAAVDKLKRLDAPLAHPMVVALH